MSHSPSDLELPEKQETSIRGRITQSCDVHKATCCSSAEQPQRNFVSEKRQAQTPPQEENKHKNMLLETSAAEPAHDAPRPFGTGERCFIECNYIFLFRKRFSFKSSSGAFAYSAFIKSLSLQTQSSVDSCTHFLLLPYLWHLICNFYCFFPLVSSERSKSGCFLGFNSANDF